MPGTYFITRSLSKNNKKNTTLRSALPYDQAKSFGLLYMVEDLKKHELVKRLVHQLEQEGKKVRVLTYLGKKKENFEFKFDFFTDKEVGFFGSLQADNIQEFIKQPFDYLINLDLAPNVLIKKIVALSKAHCRVGRHLPENEEFFELMIHAGPSDGLTAYTDNTLRYIKLISKK